MADCVFCRIASGEIPSTIVHSDERVVAFEDTAPQAPLHVLVITREHQPDVREVADPALLARLFEVAHSIARSRGVDEGGYRLVFNIGPEAGQSVFHTHLHVLGGRRMKWPPG